MQVEETPPITHSAGTDEATRLCRSQQPTGRGQACACIEPELEVRVEETQPVVARRRHTASRVATVSSVSLDKSSLSAVSSLTASIELQVRALRRLGLRCAHWRHLHHRDVSALLP